MKTKTTHTPGPWKIEKRQNSINIYGGPDLTPRLDAITGRELPPEPELLARIIYMPTAQNKGEANARLIAAAPELLEACQAVAALADEQGRMNLPMAAGMARIAITKAEGE